MGIGNRIGGILEKALEIAALACLSATAMLAFRYTAISIEPNSEFLLMIPTAFGSQDAWIAGWQYAGALALLALLVWAAGTRIRPAVLLAVAVAATAAVGIAWVDAQQTHYALFNDSRNLIAYATGMTLGDQSHFRVGSDLGQPVESMRSYFSHYPFQAGTMLYFMLVFRFFGAGNVMALQYVNVAANEVLLVCLLLIVRRLSPSRRVQNLSISLAAAFLPFWLSCLLPYGNSVGFAFGALFLACQAQAFGSRRLSGQMAWCCLSVVPLALALFVKSTLILFAIAAVIAWAVRGIRDRSPVFLAAIAALLVANGVSGLSVNMLESMTGSQYGQGMPRISWIAMGLNEGTYREDRQQAGWWDREAYEIYRRAGGDFNRQTQLAEDSVRDSLARFSDHPDYAMRFFSEKLSTEWADPTFQSLYYAASNADEDGVPAGFDEQRRYAYQPERLTYIRAFDGFQHFVYAFSLFGMLVLLFRRRARDGGGMEGSGIGDRRGERARGSGDVGLLLCLLFFTGFGCYLLWEAKSVYTLPFFVMLIPLAALGFDAVASPLANLPGHIAARFGRKPRAAHSIGGPDGTRARHA